VPAAWETEREEGVQRERAVADARGRGAMGRGAGGHGPQAADESSGRSAGELVERASAAPSEMAVGEHSEWAAGGPTGRGAGEQSEWAAGGPTGRGAGEYRERAAGALPICSPAGVALRAAEQGPGEAVGQGPGLHMPWVVGALRGWEGRVATGPQGGWAVGEGAEPQTTCEMGAAGTERGAGGGMGVPTAWTTGEHTVCDGGADIWVGTAWPAAVGPEPAMMWVSRALTALFAGTETE